MRTNIITLQELMAGRNEEFDRAVEANRVKIVRHKDNRRNMTIHGKPYEGFSIYGSYKYDRQTFLYYQGEQSKPVYNNIDFIVALLGEAGSESRFIGVYKNNGLQEGVQYQEDSPYVYNLSEVEGFDILKEKVIVDWGKAAISWHQYFRENEKDVLRIEKDFKTADGLPVFNSYEDILLTHEQLKRIFEEEPNEWKTAFQSINCIYMIVDELTGKQYIGSTYGNKGMWNRWMGYALTGHNENKSLKALFDEDPNYGRHLHWIILETLSLNVTDNEAIHRESFCKEKFCSREHGYNNN